MPNTPRSLAIYVHIPFCAKHCAYCDFNTYVEKAQSSVVQHTVDAICRDIEQTARMSPLADAPPTVPTVFFGGGTPTFLSGQHLARILNTIRAHYALEPDAEISSEANPGSSVLICVANSTGGVMGKMIDAQSICVATAATDKVGTEADIFKFVVWHSIAQVAIVGPLVLPQAYVPPFKILVPH